MRVPVSVLLALTTSIVAARDCQAANWNGSYDATYEMNMADMNLTQRRISDGHGRMRMEMTTPQGRMITIKDKPAGASYTIIPARKMAIKHTMDETSFMKDKNFVVTNDEAAKRVGAQSLGTKVIDGHPCHGYRYTHRGQTSDAWLGDDVKTLVLMTSNSPSGNVSMRLKAIKPFSGNMALFGVPADCKVVSMPPGIGMFGTGSGQAPKGRRTVSSPFMNGNPGAAPQNFDPAEMQKRMQSLRKGFSPESIQQMKQFAEQMKRQYGNAGSIR